MSTKHKSPLIKTLKRYLIYGFLLFVSISILSVILLKFIPVSTSAFMLEKHIEDYKTGKGFISIQQKWQNSDDISPHLFHAVVAAEDQRFFDHFGFDLNSIYSAIKVHSSGGKLRGASTISQQVAKNLFLSPSRSWWRKGLEVWFTLLIELFWSKDRILLVYVNIAEFGDHIFGVEAASQHFFAISAKNLSPSQAALLAASLPNPQIYNIEHPSSRLREKQMWILHQMKNLNYL